jgi:hypothetical protein
MPLVELANPCLWTSPVILSVLIQASAAAAAREGAVLCCLSSGLCPCATKAIQKVQASGARHFSLADTPNNLTIRSNDFRLEGIQPT